MSFKFWFVPILGAAITFGNVPTALPGTMHAQSTILPKSQSKCAGESGVAEASITLKVLGKTKYRVSHEELYSNYTYGNAGSGHAHHHSGTCLSFGRVTGDASFEYKDASQRDDTETPPPPILGSKGTSQYIKQTWRPNAARDKIDVAWTPDSFLQVDSSELTVGSRLVSRASLTAPGGLTGTIELSAVLDKNRKPKIDTQLTGIFKGLKSKLVSHPGGVVSLQFKQPLRWTVPGRAETFDIGLDASIDEGQLVSNACVLDPGMVAAGNTFARRTTLAQTFTPIQNGSLTKIAHGLQSISGVTNYDLLVTTTISGLPSWTGGTYTGPNVLFKAPALTVFANSAMVNAVVTIPSGQQPHLSAGTQYALILIPGNPATGDMKWRGNSGASSYPNGSAYELNGTTWIVPKTGPRDHGFKLDGLCP